jgi:potassium/sodium efflux P-type ATPase
VLGTFQEWKAEQSAAALQTLLKVYAVVRRNGEEREIPSKELVPGDICLLVSGSRVPADIRLLDIQNLAIDESLLTGESLAVSKSILPLTDTEAPISDRTNMAYGGSTVMVGRGVGVVVAIGLQTEVATIAKTVSETAETKPPLVVRMDQFARHISVGVVGACGLLAMFAVSRGIPMTEVFFMAVALAVSAIPEGLPVAMTVALSVATNRMAKRHVIVRKLTAVEGLGSCTYIASDKTGTLTVNQQTVKKIVLPSGDYFSVSGEGYTGEGEVLHESDGGLSSETLAQLRRLGTAGVLCNEAQLTCEKGEWGYHGDAVDIALLALGYKLALDPPRLKRSVNVLGSIPFESERKFAALFYEERGDNKVAVKGAVEEILTRCDAMVMGEEKIPINKDMIEKEAIMLASQGYRVLALAEGFLLPQEDECLFEEHNLPPLTFLGLVGSIDPLRPKVKDSVKECQRAGINVAMVTGDHPATALSISRELGIAETEQDVVTGRQLAEIGSSDVPQFVDLINRVRVFARVTPLQKLQIVEALVKLGHFVAVTGDGVNDAPALKKAHLGVAMGSGTDVAKDSAAMIITDDQFTSIVAGVEEGRFAYDNVRKVIALLVSCGAAEIFLFTVSILVGLPLPLTAVQLLWLNLVTNGPQDVALAFEAGESDAMSRKPRNTTEGIFDSMMIHQTIVSGLAMGLVGFTAWYWWLSMGVEEGQARNLLLLLMVFLENVHVFNCRSERRSAFKIPLRNNWILIFGVLAAQGIHILAMHVPLTQSVLKVAPVSLEEWGTLLLLASTILLTMEIFKMVKKRTGSAVTESC